MNLDVQVYFEIANLKKRYFKDKTKKLGHFEKEKLKSKFLIEQNKMKNYCTDAMKTKKR